MIKWQWLFVVAMYAFIAGIHFRENVTPEMSYNAGAWVRAILIALFQ